MSCGAAVVIKKLKVYCVVIGVGFSADGEFSGCVCAKIHVFKIQVDVVADSFYRAGSFSKSVSDNYAGIKGTEFGKSFWSFVKVKALELVFMRKNDCDCVYTEKTVAQGECIFGEGVVN